MVMDLSLIITASLAVAAIVSPVVVALINNHHNYKLRKLDLATENKIERFENYTKSLIKFLDNPNENTLETLNRWFQMSVIYVSPQTLKTMRKINYLISEGKNDIIVAEYVQKVCMQLQKDLGIYKRRK